MNKQDLIPIGVLSKITNVHIQSLRYYEKIGILIPAYIEPSSRYRYYSFSQIRIVEAIQYCVELDIPLKDFNSFISEDEKKINYAELINYGKKIAIQKIEAIQHKINHFDSLEQEILHSKECSDTDVTICMLPSKTYYIEPYGGNQTEPAFRKAVINLLNEVSVRGYKTGYDISLLAKFNNGTVEQYVGTDILNPSSDCNNEANILTLPKGLYYCTKREKSDILSATTMFAEYLKYVNSFTVIETDLFTENYSYADSSYELRCTNMY